MYTSDAPETITHIGDTGQWLDVFSHHKFGECAIASCESVKVSQSIV